MAELIRGLKATADCGLKTGRKARTSAIQGVRRLKKVEQVKMATRQHRLSEFNGGPPPADAPLQLLCEDHNGTYVLPYPCQWHGETWRNCASDEPIEAAVVGWREIRTTS